MEFFKKKRRFDATIRHGTLKMEKIKKAKDAAEKKMIVLEVEIPCTNRLLDTLDPRIGNLFKKASKQAGETDDTLVNLLDVSFEQVCIMRIFGHANYSKDSKPVIAKGGAPDDDAARLKGGKFIKRDNEPLLKISLTAPYDKQYWAWLGDNFEAEVCIETEPLQPELPLEGEAEDPGAKKAREKAASMQGNSAPALAAAE